MNTSTTTCTGGEVTECVTIYSDLPNGGDMLIFSGILLVFFLLLAQNIIFSALTVKTEKKMIGNNSRDGKEIRNI